MTLGTQHRKQSSASAAALNEGALDIGSSGRDSLSARAAVCANLARAGLAPWHRGLLYTCWGVAPRVVTWARRPPTASLQQDRSRRTNGVEFPHPFLLDPRCPRV